MAVYSLFGVKPNFIFKGVPKIESFFARTATDLTKAIAENSNVYDS
jgi:hypothetical protein